MKFSKMLAGLLGIQVAANQNSVNLTEEQNQHLKTMLGEEHASLLLEQVKAELSATALAKEELAKVKTSLSEKEDEVKAKASSIEALEQKLAELQKDNSDLKGKVEKLSSEPETDLVSAVEKVKEGTMEKVVSIGGQLFGLSGKFWDASSPWNAKAIEGAKGSTTNFKSSAVIQRMNDEFLDYLRTYPSTIDSLFSEFLKLPDHWPVITGVADRLMSATISVANVTQPRKATWSPKGDVVFKAEEMRVYPTQIDLQFNYWEMQKIETNWLNNFNKVGSQAYKIPFVVFLLSEFLKKARQEDADVLIRGVHIETPENREKSTAVSYLFRNDGLLKLIFDAREAKKYRPFQNLGSWSYANAVDYIDNFIKQIPDAVRNTEQLQMVLAPSKIVDYKRRYEQLFGTNTDYKGYPETPRDYPNIKFVPLAQLEGSDVILVTTMDNIKLLEFKPEEKSLFTIEQFLRDVYAFADYRLGIGLNHIGLATVPGDPLAFVKQMIWTNNTPLFSPNFFATSYDDGTGILSVRHNRVKPDTSFATNIKEISGNVGDILIIRGDISMTTDVKVLNGSKITLKGGDFKLKDGGDLTLIRVEDGKYKEVARTTSPMLEPTAKEFDDTILEYVSSEMIYKGAPATLSEIQGGAEGNRLRILGGASNALTVDNVAGNIKVDSQIVLDSETKFIDLVFVNNIWTEISRG